MRFAVPNEITSGETRVALVPDAIKTLLKKKHTVAVESGAGRAASILDDDFRAAGAEVIADLAQLLAGCDCLVRVRPVTLADAEAVPEGKALIGFLAPGRQPEVVQALARRRVTSFSMDAIPRITRAQSMDALSSMATIAGYKAVLIAANQLPKFLPMLTTAAGTIRPSQALILGAGVAGLQAIATARRLGAVVEAFDVRPAVKEQVQSLGATFVEAPKKPAAENLEDKGGYAKQVSADTLVEHQRLIGSRIASADLVITTAQVPGKPAPRLITAAMVASMKPGSVIIDLAADSGGNCELTQANKTVVEHHVTIIGAVNLPASMPLDASRMLARNFSTFIQEIVNDQGFTFDWNNEIFTQTCITHNGEVNAKRK